MDMLRAALDRTLAERDEARAQLAELREAIAGLARTARHHQSPTLDFSPEPTPTPHDRGHDPEGGPYR